MPFETFFGDELFFKNRSLWMRNVGLGAADVAGRRDLRIRGRRHFELSLRAGVRAGAGRQGAVRHPRASTARATSPARWCCSASCGRSFGGVAALAGLAVLLFTPSLFMWSISALKEPSYTLAAAIELACAVQMARAPQPSRPGVLAARRDRRRGRARKPAPWRQHGRARRRRRRPVLRLRGAAAEGLLLAAVVLLPAIAIGLLRMPPIQERALDAVRSWAIYHAGHVGSPGYSYRILDGRYYVDGRRIFATCRRDEAVEYCAALIRELRHRAGAVADRIARHARLSARADVLVRAAGAGAVRHRRRRAPRCDAHDAAGRARVRRGRRWSR